MTLGEKQELFASLLCQLIIRAHILGFQVRLQELARTEYQAAENERLGVGVLNSAHRNKLAIDIVLMDRGSVCDTPEYTKLGEWWEAQDDNCRWGGRFDDAGHFSITHWGWA